MGKKILFVDDDTSWHVVVTTWLQDAGYEVLTAADATEAMGLAEGVALIILDLNLAGENGVMLMKFLKQNDPELPIILYTGMEHDGEAIMALLQEGAHSYVRKGSQQELLQAVDLILQ
jgi:CheY-like chemotaxis protein